MKKIIIFTINNVIEGVVGAIVMIVTSYIIKKYLKLNISIRAGLSFLMGWIARKMTINIFKNMKNHNAYLDKGITINI